MNHPNIMSRSLMSSVSKPEFLLDCRSLANAETKLFDDPNSALCRLRAYTTIDYIEATNLIPSEPHIRSMMREELCRDIPEELAKSAASELLAEIFWQMRADQSSVSLNLGNDW
jgi:hypothetical protein